MSAPAWLAALIAARDAAQATEWLNPERRHHFIDLFRVHADPWLVHLRDHKGGNMDEWPADLRVREMPG